MYDSELDHYEEKENEWRAKEDVRVYIKEEIKKAMKELECIPDIAVLSYDDLCIHTNLDLQKGSRFQSLTPFDEWATV